MNTKILARLQRLCIRRECCSQDILRKAQDLLEGDEQAAREMLDSLIADRFVDDARYAAAFAREKSAIAGWGPHKIRHALAAKGIRECAEAMAEVDEEASEARLRKSLEVKWRSVAPDKLKLIRFALSRGYDYDTVRPLIEEITAQNR